MVVLDTYALVKLLKKEPGFEAVKKQLELGKNFNSVIQTTLYELLYVCTRDYLDQGLELDDALIKALDVIDSLKVYLKEMPLDTQIMIEAVKLRCFYKKLKLSHFDCLALGAAKASNQTLLSGEKALRRVKEVKVIG